MTATLGFRVHSGWAVMVFFAAALRWAKSEYRTHRRLQRLEQRSPPAQAPKHHIVFGDDPEPSTGLYSATLIRFGY